MNVTIFFLDGGGVQYRIDKYYFRKGFLHLCSFTGKKIMVAMDQIKMLIFDPFQESEVEEKTQEKFEPHFV